jgi:CubicO group peptidase (beta-lactamase class C family)
LTNTDVFRASNLQGNQATGYIPRANSRTAEPIRPSSNLLKLSRQIFRGSGSMVSTITDLARWEIALQKGDLLNFSTQAEMQSPVKMNSGRSFDYGLGWFLDSINGHPVVFHGGNIWGYSACISRFPADHLSILLLTNKDNEPGDALAKKIAEQYVPGLVIDKAAAPIIDKNPTLTEQLLAYMNGDRSLILPTPEWQTSINTVRGKLGIARIEAYGKRQNVKALELIDEWEHVNGTERQYRIITDNGYNEPLLRVVTTPEGQIAFMRLSSEE